MRRAQGGRRGGQGYIEVICRRKGWIMLGSRANRTFKGGSGVPSLDQWGDAEAETVARDGGQLCEVGLVL